MAAPNASPASSTPDSTPNATSLRAQVGLLTQKFATAWLDANTAHASSPIERNVLALHAATEHRDDMHELASLSQTGNCPESVVVGRLTALKGSATAWTYQLLDRVISSGDYFTHAYEVQVHDTAAKLYAEAMLAIFPPANEFYWGARELRVQVDPGVALLSALGRRFSPSLADVEAVAERLHEGFPTRSGGTATLPPELARAVLLRADYAHPIRTVRRQLVQGCDLDTRYLTTDAVTPDALVVKQGQEFGRLCRVEVVCLSHDQGWASGEGSWTWGTLLVVDAADDSVVLHEEEAYRNERANGSWQLHERTWDEGSELVRRLKSKGGRVALRLRSMYPGWSNHVACAAVTLFCL